MAGVLEEFDEATPLRGTYCSRLTAEEYEEQGSACTEQALAELLKHLDRNPQVYKDILSKKKKQEQEEAGLLSYVKVKLFSFFAGEESVSQVSDQECEEKLGKLKTDMAKAFDYSQESKGRRFSRRLAEKRLRNTQQSVAKENVVPTPPLPPPPPPCATPLVHATLTRRPLTERKHNKKRDITSSADSKSYHIMMLQQIKGTECKRRLRKTAEKSPGGTPLTGWPKRRHDPELLPYFNSKLVEKFKNTQQSPNIQSPTHTMASPGSFESPVALQP